MARSSGHIIGPLQGIPVAVKDIIDIRGKLPPSSMVWKDRRSSLTATLVRRMVEAGMIVLGKTHTVEFAMGSFGTNQHMGSPKIPGILRTPCHRGHAGLRGSCCGTFAMGHRYRYRRVVRIPSAWCGLTGLKTSVGESALTGFPSAIPWTPRDRCAVARRCHNSLSHSCGAG